MSSISYYILQIAPFMAVILIGISILSFILYSISNNFKNKFINVYGFFASLDDISLIMLSSCLLKEISLIYCVFSISSFSMVYLYIFLIFSFIYSFFSFNIGVFIKEFAISGIEYLIIYFFYLLSAFLIDVKYSKIVVYYIFILSAILIACSIYFVTKNIAYIISKDSQLRRNLFVKDRKYKKKKN